MKKLLAPNGKPTNLTPEQYKLVRTPAFKKWFGDWENDTQNASKVVDENGEPLVCYHGTNVKFSIFDLKYFGKTDKGWYGKGHYFTPNKNWSFAKDTVDLYGGEEVIYEVFLDIKNPIIGKAYAEQGSNLVGLAKEKNCDGVIIKYDYGHEKYDNIAELIVWKSSKIKLADGTNTTFDSNNPDIRYEKGGSIYPYTEKLIKELKKHSDYKKGIVGIDKETGQKYRHDRYILKYPFASYWLIKLWEKSAEENGDKNSKNFIYNKKYSFAFDRGKFKGERDGKISFTEEILLSDDEYNRGGKLKTYWYKGLFN